MEISPWIGGWGVDNPKPVKVWAVWGGPTNARTARPPSTNLGGRSRGAGKTLNPKPYTGATERGLTRISTLNSCLNEFPRTNQKDEPTGLKFTKPKEGAPLHK